MHERYDIDTSIFNLISIKPLRIHSFSIPCPLISFRSLRSNVACHSECIRTHRSSIVFKRYGRIMRAKTHHTTLFFARGKEGNDGIGGWLCDTRATPANGRAEPGRQTIDICVQNGRQERHPPYSKSPFAPCHLLPPFSATALTPIELSTSLSRMPPKLFNFETQPLTANQPILLSSSREGVSFSLSFCFLSRIYPLSTPLLYLSRFFISLDPLLFFFSAI